MNPKTSSVELPISGQLGEFDSPPEPAEAPDSAQRPDAAELANNTGEVRPAALFEGQDLSNITMRWREIQSEFVDEPRRAIKDADALVAELMKQITDVFSSEHAHLEDRWAEGVEVSTEDLRQTLQSYRTFFDRLLAA